MHDPPCEHQPQPSSSLQPHTLVIYKWCKAKRFFSQNFKQRIEHNSELPHSFAPNLESADASYDGESDYESDVSGSECNDFLNDEGGVQSTLRSAPGR